MVVGPSGQSGHHAPKVVPTDDLAKSLQRIGQGPVLIPLPLLAEMTAEDPSGMQMSAIGTLNAVSFHNTLLW